MMDPKRVIFKILFPFIIFSILSMSIFSQTAKETRKWKACQKKADKADNSALKIKIYKKFLKKNQNSYYASKAKSIIEEPKDFETAKLENTIGAYKSYILKHHNDNSDHNWEAEKNIRDIFFRDKTINDLISELINVDITGKYISDSAASQFVEKGTLRGEKFKIMIFKYDNGDILNIPSIYNSLLNNIHFNFKGKTWTCETKLTLSRASISFKANNVPKSLSNHGAANIINWCQNHTKYLEIFFFRDDPFFIVGLAKESSVFDKIREYYKSIIK